MIKAEFKKLFIKNKLIYFALGVIVLSLIFQLSSNTYTQFSLDNQQSFYEEYMARLKGKTNEDKTAIISKIYNDYNNIGNELADLDNDYKNGNISTETYEEQREKLSEFSSCGNAVDYLVSCADYVNENPNRHYYIDYLGWTQVFQNYGFDFLLMIFVLAMSVGAVMIEYNSDMTAVNAVSEKGRKFYSTSKIILVLSFTALLTLILSVIHPVVFSFKYDLSGWNYPLESLKAYSGSSKNLSIIGAYILSVLIKIFGYCCFAVFTMFFAVLLKKYAPAMTFSLALALLPMYILNSNTDGQTLYLIPLPAGVMISTGYIKGTQKSEFTEDYFFREVEYSQMILVFLILFSAVLAMTIYVSHRLSGKRFAVTLNKKAMTAALLICVCTTLCSCDSDYEFETADENYIVDQDMNTVYSKSENIYVPLDGIPTDETSQAGFISGENLIVKNGNVISIIDLKTYEKTELLRLGKNYDMSGFLGLEDLFPSISEMSIDVSAQNYSNLVGGEGSKLYFSSQNGTVEYDIKTGKSKSVY